MPQFVALLFLHCHPIIGINNGRGVLACAKLGIATVGEKGPWSIVEPRQFYCTDMRKSIPPRHPSTIQLAAEGEWVRTSLSGRPSCYFLLIFFFFPRTPLTKRLAPGIREFLHKRTEYGRSLP